MKKKVPSIPHRGWCAVYSDGHMGQVQKTYAAAKALKEEFDGERVARVEVREVKPRKRKGQK